MAAPKDEGSATGRHGHMNAMPPFRVMVWPVM
jgi:hypothetical protein